MQVDVGTPVKIPRIAVNFAGIVASEVNEVSSLQFSKAASPIEVTEPGRVNLVSPLQPPKATFPIDVSELDSVIVVSPLHSAKA